MSIYYSVGQQKISGVEKGKKIISHMDPALSFFKIPHLLI